MRTDLDGWAGEAAMPVRHALNGPTMGTRYAAVFFAPAAIDTGAIGLALQAAVDEVDDQMSTYKPNSDLMRFNALPVGVWAQLPGALLTVIDAGLDIGRRSGGAFDIGSGDLVEAWGFGASRDRPDAGELARLAATPRRPAGELVERDSLLGLRKRGPITLDLSGIAKGFGVDRLAKVLDGFGLRSYLVSIDGEVRARGTKPGGEPWRVAVEVPVADRREVAGHVELQDAALATSGSYRHRRAHAGRTVSHTMDPATGQPVDNGIGAVTVRAASCMLADAWATAVLVAGPERGLALAQANGVEAMIQPA